MKIKFWRWLGALMLAMFTSVNAFAAAGDITCTVVNVGTFDPIYLPNSPSKTSREIQFNVSCTRSAKGSSSNPNDASATFTVSANNGSGLAITPNTVQNRALKSGNAAFPMNYDLYTDANCSTLWSASPSKTVGPLSSTGLTPAIVTTPAYSVFVCIDAGQTTLPATSATPIAQYVDTVTLTPSGTATGTGGVLLLPVAANLPVNVTLAQECAFTAPLGATLTLPNYTSFTGSSVSASMGYATRCTNQWPYTMSLEGLTTGNNTSPINGVVAGLNYTLEIITPNAAVHGATVSVTGNGAAQANSIKAVVAAGQAGSCAGTACTTGATSLAHTLTFTY